MPIEFFVSNKDFDKYDCFKEEKEKYNQITSKTNRDTYGAEYKDYVKIQGETAKGGRKLCE